MLAMVTNDGCFKMAGGSSISYAKLLGVKALRPDGTDTTHSINAMRSKVADDALRKITASGQLAPARGLFKLTIFGHGRERLVQLPGTRIDGLERPDDLGGVPLVRRCQDVKAVLDNRPQTDSLTCQLSATGQSATTTGE
jgi:hypothetical protein